MLSMFTVDTNHTNVAYLWLPDKIELMEHGSVSPALLGNNDRLTNQPTDRRKDRVIGKLHFKKVIRSMHESS